MGPFCTGGSPANPVSTSGKSAPSKEHRPAPIPEDVRANAPVTDETLLWPDKNPVEFVRIPGGAFLMGSDKSKDPQAFDDEVWPGTPHGQGTLGVSDFYIGRYSVTVTQFKAFVDASGFKLGNNQSLSDLPEHLVRYVSWNEALKYCN